jgi:drug/metabolite transporter (DMT)-like permease
MKAAAALKAIGRYRVDHSAAGGHGRMRAENETMVGYIGPILVLAFCLSQALRDVYFGQVFQQVDFFAVILIAFSISTLGFGAITAIKTPEEFGKLRAQLRTVLAINLTTALAWSCYFFALTHLEPSIVNTVHSGMGPLTVVALAACGVKLAKPGVLRRAERVGYAGIALSLLALAAVVLSGRSGLPDTNRATSLLALVLLAISGVSITVSLLYCKRLHDRGVSAEAVTTVRYLALILLAAGVAAGRGGTAGIGGAAELATISLAATALIVLPLFALQVGIARTAPLCAHVIRSLGPVCVFALQQLDGRLTYSTPTFICIAAYSVCALASNLAHGWRGETPAPDLSRPVTRNAD